MNANRELEADNPVQESQLVTLVDELEQGGLTRSHQFNWPIYSKTPPHPL
ncbi:hypothetical protein JX580_05160 [Thiomicrospira microaerophila]|nr:hypothetical protein [Thiomicrospira microaerophila]UQB43266.1 hypothetical protein JX580_05160 [Thiomicrospira microaerophila]